MNGGGWAPEVVGTAVAARGELVGAMLDLGTTIAARHLLPVPAQGPILASVSTGHRDLPLPGSGARIGTFPAGGYLSRWMSRANPRSIVRSEASSSGSTPPAPCKAGGG